MFDKIDVDKSGKLSVKEIKRSLFEVENGEALFDCLRAGDANNDGEIDFDEFIACALNVNIFTNEQYLKKAFDYFDKDKNGQIDF